jgi:hypothetical protein
MKDNKTKIIKSILTAVTLIVVAGAIGYGVMEPKINFSNDSIEISGMYGVSITADEIESVEMRSELPKTTSRTNGLDFLSVKKGHYRLEEFGKGRLFVHDTAASPVIIKLHDESVVIIALKDRVKNEEIFNKIKELINS